MTNPNPASDLVSIGNLINASRSKLSLLTLDQKQHRGMVQSLLDNDLNYREAKIISDKQAKITKLAKQNALNQSEAVRLLEKTKDLRLQIAEVKNALSDYLSQYVNLSGSRQIEGQDGQLLDIVYTARLVKRSAPEPHY